MRRLKQTIKEHIFHPIVRIGRREIFSMVPYEIYGGPAYHNFVGYYDIQPFSNDRTKILAGRCISSHAARAMDVPLEIGCFDLETGLFEGFSETRAWSWQMGCRLQWVMWKGRECALYNDIVDGVPQTIIYDVAGKKRVDVLPVPTYAMSSCGRYVVTLDFDQLERCRQGYGYDWKESFERVDATLILYDCETGEQNVLIEARTLGDGYFNHIHFNPSGTRILCFYIWHERGKRRVKALTMDLDGKNVANVTDGTHVSHYWWVDDNRLLFYCTDPVYGMGYHLYHQSGGHIDRIESVPKLDGHPRIFDDWIISDTVVDRRFERHVWAYHMVEKRRVDIASFYSPPQFIGPNRCDLHPRVSGCGRYVAVDSTHDGYRQVVVLDVGDILT